MGWSRQLVGKGYQHSSSSRLPRVKIQREGRGARVSTGQAKQKGLEPRACFPFPHPGNRGCLFGHQPAGFELGQRESGVGRGEGPREWRDSILLANALGLELG